MMRLIQGVYGGGGGGGGGSTATTTFSPDTTAHYANPDRGLYGFADSFYLQQMGPSGGLAGLRTRTPIPFDTAIALIDLRSYPTTATLPSSFLTDMNTRFGYVRNNGVKVIIRPVYNYQTGGTDASLSIIQGHLSQMASVLAANKDVWIAIEMGGLGDFAEFHDGSTGGAGNAATKLAVMQAFIANTPSTHQVLSRYPADLMTWYSTVLTQAQYLAGLTNPTTQSRLGSYWDGLYADNTYGGTFSGRPGANSFTQAAMQTYSAALGALNLCGGEVTAGSNEDHTDAGAMAGGSTYGMGFLNGEANSNNALFTDWNAQGTLAKVARLYGYRLQLDNLTYPTAVSPGSAAMLSVNLRNYGFARLPLQRQLVVTLRHTSTGETYSANAGDLRALPSNATNSTIFTATIVVPSGATTGTYAVLLSAPDVNASIATDVRYAARFANANSGAQSWDATNARFNAGVTITVVAGSAPSPSVGVDGNGNALMDGSGSLLVI